MLTYIIGMDLNQAGDSSPPCVLRSFRTCNRINSSGDTKRKTMNPLSRPNNATPPIFTRTSAGLLTDCTHRAGGKSAFVWNYLKAFAQLILNGSAVKHRRSLLPSL